MLVSKLMETATPHSPFGPLGWAEYKERREHNLVEAHCYGIGRTGQIFEQSRSSEETDRNVDVSTAKVFVSTMHCTDEDLRGRNVYISICFFTAT